MASRDCVVVGLSAYFHDSSCCLLRNGRLVAAAQEERFSRVKHDRSLPLRAFRYCLAEAGLSIQDVDCVAYYEDPLKKLERQLWMRPDVTAARATELWWRARRPIHDIRTLLGWEGRVETVTHHEAHAASAFFFSGFDEAAVLTVDAVGEWASTTYGSARGAGIHLFEEVVFPHSLGLLYSTLTNYLGFGVNDGEFKVMGLAPYGEPKYIPQMERLVSSRPGGGFELDLAYFDFANPARMYTDALPELFGCAPRPRESAIDAFHCDVARSLQQVLEAILLEKVRWLHDRVPAAQLCLAGGVALNCVANGRILAEGPFRRLFVQPAAGDAGGSLGAAALAHIRLTGQRPAAGRMQHAFLGPAAHADEIARLLRALSLEAVDFRGREDDLLRAIADRLRAGQVIGWLHGRMEFGPRSLGARSILADPRNPHMRDRVNALVKKRESFRPFAPAVLESAAADHFDLDHSSPFMLETCRVTSPIGLPAITHVDGSARVQTVDEASNPRFARLLRTFGEQTGCPILLNTSFNVRDEPIVCSPLDAIRCFATSQIDAVVLEDFLVDRSALGNASYARRRQGPGEEAPRHLDAIYTFE